MFNACKHWGYTRQLGPERETLVGMINPIEQREKLVVSEKGPHVKLIHDQRSG